eukprot:2464003-Ditylum_brightwellii.AAC.1
MFLMGRWHSWAAFIVDPLGIRTFGPLMRGCRWPGMLILPVWLEHHVSGMSTTSSVVSSRGV